MGRRAIFPLCAGMQMIRFLAPFYVVFVFVEIFAGALRGMGNTLVPMIITFSGTCLLRIIWLLTYVPSHHTIEAIEASYPITWVITAIMLTGYYLLTSLQSPGQDRHPDSDR